MLQEKQRRVLLLAPQPFFANRGTPINVRAMAEVLAAGGYEVSLLTYHCGCDIEIPGVNHIRSFAVPWIKQVPIGPSWTKIFLDIILCFKAAGLVFTRRFDVLHGVEEGGCIAGMFALMRGLPYIFDMDSSMPDQLQNSGFLRANWALSLIRTLESFFIRQSSAVLTVCTALSERAKQYSPETVVFQVEDFPCESSVSVNAELAGKLRKEHFAEDRKVILYTGNLESYQGIDLLLRSFALLIQAEGSSQRVLPLLALVGGGSADSPEIKRYVALAGELGIRDHLRFFGSRPAEEMGTFMALADVLVSPRAEGENTPLKIFSYMAAGKPIAATNIRSHTQVLDDESAFLAQAEPEDFSKILAAALHDEEKTRMVVSNAERLVRTKFNRESFERRLLEMYAAVLGPAGSACGCSADLRGRKSEGSCLFCLSALFFSLCFI